MAAEASTAAKALAEESSTVKSVVPLSPAKSRVVAGLSFATATASGTPPVLEKRSLRNSKIEATQTKLNSALAGLADIMKDVVKPPAKVSEIETGVAGFVSESNKRNVAVAATTTAATIRRQPPLPSGRLLRIEIESTWGDTNYVGLNGT
jgi:hypothetical protein